MSSVDIEPVELAGIEILEQRNTVMHVIALNANGRLRGQRERLAVLAELLQPDVIVVSETGFEEKFLTHKRIAKNFLDKYEGFHTKRVFARGRQLAGKRGVSLWLKKKWVPLVDQQRNVIHDDLQLVGITIRNRNNTEISIVGMYGDPTTTNQTEYWTRFRAWYDKTFEGKNEKIVIIGDMNQAPYSEIDRDTQAINPRNAVRPFLGLLGMGDEPGVLADAWRGKHQDEREYTWSGQISGRKNKEGVARKEYESRSRIDLALVSLEHTSSVLSCEILTEIGEQKFEGHAGVLNPLFPDHTPIEIRIELGSRCFDSDKPIAKPPECIITELNRKAMQNKENVELFQAALTLKLAMDTDPNMKAVDRFNGMMTMAYDVAAEIFETKDRVINKERAIELMSSKEDVVINRCIRVLRAKRVICEAAQKKQLSTLKMLRKLYACDPEIKRLKEEASKEEVGEFLLQVRAHKVQAEHRRTAEFRTTVQKRIDEMVGKAYQSEGSARWWKLANFMKTSSTEKLTTIMKERPDGTRQVITEPDAIKEEVKAFWQGVFAKCVPEEQPETPWLAEEVRPSEPPAESQQKLLAEISKEEFAEAIKALPKNKAVGPDKIPGELLKALDDKQLDQMRKDLSGMIATCETPNEWRKAKIYTLHKGGDATNCANYRPITLTCVPYKLFMTILTKRLSAYVEKHGLLGNSQGGFRKGRSCIDKVSLLTLAAKKLTHRHVTFIDITKAYDSVGWGDLERILLHQRIPKRFVELILEVYRGGEAYVITPFGDTDLFPLGRGLKQGCPMSPILFDLFLEPLLRWMDSTRLPDQRVLAFADDMAFIAGDLAGLQGMTDKASAFFYAHGLQIGVAQNKTKSVYMTNVENPPPEMIITVPETVRVPDGSGGTFLRKTGKRNALFRLTGSESYKYLGVWWNAKLDWSVHVKEKSKILGMHLGYLRHAYYDVRQAMVIMNAIVGPAVSYGLEVVEVDASQLRAWDRQLASVLNQKCRIRYGSRADWWARGYDEGGEGLVLFVDRNAIMKTAGLLRRLNGVDTENRELAREAWEQRDLGRPELGFKVEKNPAMSTPSGSIRLVVDKEKFKAADILVKHGLEDVTNWCDDGGVLLPAETMYKKLEEQRKILVAQKQQQSKERERRASKTAPADNFTITINKRQWDADWEKVSEAICVRHFGSPPVKSLHVVPMLLHRLNHVAALDGVKHTQCDKEQLEAWSDGTVSKAGIVGYAICFEGNSWHIRERAPHGRSSYDAELTGACMALGLHDPAKDFVLYSDNKAAVDDLVRVVDGRVDERFYESRMHLREALMMAAAVAQEKRKAGKTVTIHHVYSHLLDEKGGLDPKIREERLEKMKEAFPGGKHVRVLSGNMEADRRTHDIAKHTSERQIQQTSPCDPDFVIRTANNEPVHNLRKELKARASQERSARMNHEAQKDLYTYYLLNKNIDWTTAGLILRCKERKLVPIQNFVRKARRSQFSHKVQWEMDLSREEVEEVRFPSRKALSGPCGNWRAAVRRLHTYQQQIH
jgi:exonuclease III